jgi:3-oxoacyl-[acyl-carrier-protein] synthase II
MDNHNKRVVITGMGIVAPNGIGVDNFWDSLVHGRSGVRRITHFDASTYPCKIASEVKDFDPLDYMDAKIVKRLDRYVHFSLASASMALEDSGIEIPYDDPYRIGVFVGTAIGGGGISENGHLIFVEKGFKRLPIFTLRGISTHSASAAISESFILKGPNTTTSSGCNSGLDACYLAYNTIRLGDADVMVVSAGEAPITPYIFAVFSAVGIFTVEDGDPKKAVKPYDINASGTVLGEGGGTIILEELNHAVKRGAKIYGEILGYCSANEAFIFGTKTDSETMAKAFKTALQRSRLDPKDIDYINAHGNAIVDYDLAETQAIKNAFGELAYQIPVTSIKPITGQSLSPTGIYQVITSLLVIKNGIIPPTLNHQTPAPHCDLNYVPNYYIKKDVNTALMNAHGFGGIHTVLIVGKLNNR